MAQGWVRIRLVGGIIIVVFKHDTVLQFLDDGCADDVDDEEEEWRWVRIAQLGRLV